MKDLVLHIGWPKTGTSALQALLARNEDALLETGILYPKIERWSDAHHCVCEFFIEHDDPLIPPPLGTFNEFVTHLSSDEFAGANKVVLSSEGFCRATALKREAFEELSRYFHLKVIATVREPFFWANSLLNEFAKGQLFHAGEIDLKQLGLQIILRDVEYSHRLHLWADLIGRENVFVTCANEGTDFVSASLSTLGIERETLKEATLTQPNASMSLGALQLISWLCRKRYELDHSAKVAIDRRLREIRHESIPNLLPPDLERSIIEKTPDICAQLSRDWLGGRSPFSNTRISLECASTEVLSSPDILSVAEHALSDRADILRDLVIDLSGT